MFGWMKSKELSAPAALTQSDLVAPTTMLSALELSVRDYLKQTDEGLLVYPAAKRRLNDADGNIRAVWEHTRLEACRYVIMVPRRDVELLIDPARQAEMIDAFLRQKPHEETVVDFTGVPAEDYSLAIGAGLNWLGHCAILARVTPDKFKRTRRDFRHLVVLAQQWWRLDGAQARHDQMLENHDFPPLMFYLIWQTFTRLAKEIAIASIYGYSIDRASEDEERRFRTTSRSRPQEPAATLTINAEGVARLLAASDPTDLL
jgi:hypothetical protein